MNIVDWMLITLLFINVVTMLRCDVISRRIDTVHKRITLELSLNKLRSGWAEAEAEAATESLFKRLKRRRRLSTSNQTREGER